MVCPRIDARQASSDKPETMASRQHTTCPAQVAYDLARLHQGLSPMRCMNVLHDMRLINFLSALERRCRDSELNQTGAARRNSASASGPTADGARPWRDVPAG